MSCLCCSPFCKPGISSFLPHSFFLISFPSLVILRTFRLSTMLPHSIFTASVLPHYTKPDPPAALPCIFAIPLHTTLTLQTTLFYLLCELPPLVSLFMVSKTVGPHLTLLLLALIRYSSVFWVRFCRVFTPRWLQSLSSIRGKVPIRYFIQQFSRYKSYKAVLCVVSFFS